MSPGPSSTEALSLKLPVASKSKAKRRRWRRPPNWKLLLALMGMDVNLIAVTVLTVAAGWTTWPFLITGCAAAVDLRLLLGQWRDGGVMTPQHRRATVRVVIPMYLSAVVLSMLVFALGWY